MSGSFSRASSGASRKLPDGELARVVYRSRAVGPVTPPDLRYLTETAQARNRREAITGVMLYDNSRYFQWLEGPADGVDRVMGSIRNDRRHTDVEVLDSRPTPTRMFAEWSMKLATTGSLAVPTGAIDPPADIVETLRRQPDAAPVLLVKLRPAGSEVAAIDVATADALAHLPLQDKVRGILRRVMLSTVIPVLAGSAGPTDAGPTDTGPAANLRAAELAELLVAADPAAAMELIDELAPVQAPFSRLYATLFEPAARSLGDLWSEDLCTEFDVTIGLCRLQAAVRMLGSGTLDALPGAAIRPVVLIVPEPGELHRLGAALDGDVLRGAGWTPNCAFPTDDQGVEELVASSWVDVLDLSLSTAFRRDHILPQLSETIARARRASQNPALMVMVGGRLFFEPGMAASAAGADLATRTATRVDRAILQTLSTHSATFLPVASAS